MLLAFIYNIIKDATFFNKNKTLNLTFYKIIINNYLLEDLAETDKVKRDFVFFEDHFSGVRPFEMAVNIVDSNNSFKNPKVWQEIDKLEIYLKDSYGLGFIVSPITFIKSLNKALHNGDQYYYMLPNDSLSLQKVNTYIKKTANNKELKSYVSNDFKVGRLSARQTDLGGRIIAQKNKDLAHYVATNIDSNLIKVQVTGMAHLIDKNNADLASDMLIGLFIDFIVIGFIFFWLYRSFKVTLIAILVNMLPLLVIGGIMGFSGIHLKVSTSIIFSIAIGIAVDDTVHILSKLRLELLKGKSLLYALKHTYLHTGKAVVVTTLILSSGFFTLVLSDFASIFYMGLLITITLVCAILSDLLLLPVLCIYWLKKEDLTFMKKKI